MPDKWNDAFLAIRSQLASPPRSDPKSPTNAYFAYLDKADLNITDGSWYLMFDMIPAEASLLGLADDSGDEMPPPVLPTIIFHAHGVSQAAVWKALQLATSDEPAEGSWYALLLDQGGDPETQLVGDLYHPDTDFDPKQPDYGRWSVSASSLIALPGPSRAASLMSPPPARQRRLQATALDAKSQPRTFRAVSKTQLNKANRFKPVRKHIPLTLRRTRRIVPPPPPPPPGYGALGVMAIGQGGFNLVLQRGTREPAFYYDTGYPLGFFLSSVPNTMRVGNGAFQGPIWQNAAANLEVILSHWDWDHWRFGAFNIGTPASLANLPWTVPVQPMSPTAAIFLGNVAVVNAVPVGAPAIGLANGATLYKLAPGVAPHAFFINNSGLAVRIPVDVAGVASAPVLLTGDGNFNFLPGPALAGLMAVGAVHHGSNNHGAAAGLPAGPLGTTGRIAYSYGITAAGNHAYGFPAAAAVAAYQAANWDAPTEQSTAEGANINAGPAAPGNIRLGDQGALPGAYAATAFAAIGYALP